MLREKRAVARNRNKMTKKHKHITGPRERGIMFSAPMIRAILKGHKTMTRRPVKPHPEPDRFGDVIECRRYHPTKINWRTGEEYPGESVFGFADENGGWPCPFGAPGGRLWVREMFYIDTMPVGRLPLDPPPEKWRDHIYYLADALTGRRHACCALIPECCCGEVGKPKWRLSRHMPRWASRITLEITDIRAERVREIGSADAWRRNDWVWVITFKRISKANDDQQ